MAEMTDSSGTTYLGDGVYVKEDGYGLVLSTEDGVRTTNTIWLEPEVWYALKAYALRRGFDKEE